MGVYAFLYELIIKRTTELREKPLLARDENTLHAKQRPPKLTVAAYSILKHHNLNHHDDYYRTISKIISGILTMVYSAVNHPSRVNVVLNRTVVVDRD